MGLTKSALFNDKKNTLAARFKVLAHPARLSIVQHIINKKECICSDLVDELGLAQATISQHLKELKNIGLIQGTIEGKSVCYCINLDVWNSFYEEFKIFFEQQIDIKTCC